jgi:hypothetical protein
VPYPGFLDFHKTSRWRLQPLISPPRRKVVNSPQQDPPRGEGGSRAGPSPGYLGPSREAGRANEEKFAFSGGPTRGKPAKGSAAGRLGSEVELRERELYEMEIEEVVEEGS